MPNTLSKDSFLPDLGWALRPRICSPLRCQIGPFRPDTALLKPVTYFIACIHQKPGVPDSLDLKWALRSRE